jgi:cobalamin synthase
MKDAHFTVFAAVLGAVMTTIALIELIPEGKWLYLLLLVFGTQSMAMAIRAANHADEDQ